MYCPNRESDRFIFLLGNKKRFKLRNLENLLNLNLNKLLFFLRDPGGIRTHDPQLRRLLLYPTELRDRFISNAKVMIFFIFAKNKG